MCLDLICRRTTRCTQDVGHYFLLYCKLGKSCSALLIHLWHSKTCKSGILDYSPSLLPPSECNLMPQGEHSSFQGLNGGAEPSGTFHIPTTCIIGIIFILVQVSKSCCFPWQCNGQRRLPQVCNQSIAFIESLFYPAGLQNTLSG